MFQERDVILTLDDIKFLTSGTRTTEDQMDLIVTKLLEMEVKILMLRTEEGVKVGCVMLVFRCSAQSIIKYLAKLGNETQHLTSQQIALICTTFMETFSQFAI